MSEVSPDRSVSDVPLRPAQAEDSRRVWAWRNDPETRQASVDSTPIPFPVHERWFRESLARHDRRVYIIVADEQASGVVRLDISGREAEVSIHLAPERRRRGMGTAALRVLAGLAFESLGLERLMALVKTENSASRKAFLAAGFRVAAEAAGQTLTFQVFEKCERRPGRCCDSRRPAEDRSV